MLSEHGRLPVVWAPSGQADLGGDATLEVIGSDATDCEKDTGMDTSAEPPFLAGRLGGVRWRPAAYWLATVLVAAELDVGGIWDIARIPYVRDLVAHLGYPSYFLVLLGAWKVLGAVALLVPRRPLLKEWAYAGAFFTYTGAIVSHLATGYALGEVALLAVLTTLTVLSWALRPPSRRTTSP
jgi:DoxX-like family